MRVCFGRCPSGTSLHAGASDQLLTEFTRGDIVLSANVMRAIATAVRLTFVFLIASSFAVASLACVSVVLVFFLGVVLQFTGGLFSLLASYIGSWLGAAYGGAIVLRVAAILLPMRGDGKRRVGPIVLLGTFIVTIHVAIATVLTALADFAVEFGETTGHSWESQFEGLGALLGAGITVLLYPHILAMIIVPAVILLKRHATSWRDPRFGSVLFLRRFDGRGDSAALAALYHASPKRVPVLFLLAPRGGWRVWDPYLLGLGSIRLPNIWKGTPFFLRSSQTWEDDVERCVSLASAIVMDTTEITAGVRREMDLIAAQVAWPRTITIRCEGAPSVAVPSGSHASLVYAPRWSAARGRLVLSVIAAVSTTIIAMTLLRGQVPWSPLATAVIGLSLLALYTLLFLRPLPDPEFTRSLRRAMSEITAADTRPCNEA